MNSSTTRHAPGQPGIPPKWTSSAKDGVGTALDPSSRVWFTLSHGILNEVYYPRVDQACVRDMGLLVADGDGFFSEEKRDTHRRPRGYEASTSSLPNLLECKQLRHSTAPLLTGNA